MNDFLLKRKKSKLQQYHLTALADEGTFNNGWLLLTRCFYSQPLTYNHSFQWRIPGDTVKHLWWNNFRRRMFYHRCSTGTKISLCIEYIEKGTPLNFHGKLLKLNVHFWKTKKLDCYCNESLLQESSITRCCDNFYFLLWTLYGAWELEGSTKKLTKIQIFIAY